MRAVRNKLTKSVTIGATTGRAAGDRRAGL